MAEPAAAPAASENAGPFLTAVCRSVLAYYLAARGARPMLPHAELDPGRLVHALPHLLLFEMNSPEMQRIRLAGTAFRTWFGFELTGRNWISMGHPDERAVRQRRVDAAWAQPCGICTRMWQFRDGLPRRRLEAVTLPMAPRRDDGPPVMLVALEEIGGAPPGLRDVIEVRELQRVEWEYVDLGAGKPPA